MLERLFLKCTSGTLMFEKKKDVSSEETDPLLESKP